MPNELSDIVSRLKRNRGFISDAQVAEALGISPQALSNHKLRGTIPFKALKTYCAKENIPLHSLIEAGELEVYGLATHAVTEEGEQMYITNEGILSISDVCDRLGLDLSKFSGWLSKHQEERSKEQVGISVPKTYIDKIVAAVKQDSDLAEIVSILVNELPEHKRYVIEMLDLLRKQKKLVADSK